MSGQNIGNLKVTIGADTADLARGVGRAKAHLQSLSRVAKVAGAAAAASFAAATVGLTAMTKQGLEAVDAQAKMARSVDGTIDGLRAVQIAGSDAGVSVAAMNKSLQQMGKYLAEAAAEGKGPAVDALDRLGLSAQALIDADVDERVSLIADRIKGLGLGAQESAGLMRDLGVRSNEVSLALINGSDAFRAARKEVQAFGLSMSEDAAAQVETANDAMARLSFVAEGLRAKLAVGLAPMLTDLAIRFQGMAQDGGPLQDAIDRVVASFTDFAAVLADPAFIDAATLFATTFLKAVSGLARGMVVLAENAEIAGTAMIGLGAAMAFFSGPIGLAIAAVAGGVFLLSSRLGDAETAADDAAEAEKRLDAALKLVDTSNANAVASGEDLIATHIDQARAAVEAAKAELALVRAREQTGNALLDENPLTAGGNSGYAERMAENTSAAEAELSKAEKQLERYQRTLEGFRMSQFPSRGTRPGGASDDPGGAGSGDPGTGSGEGAPAELVKELEKLITTIDPATARAKQLAAGVALLDKALEAGAITQEQYNERVKQLNDHYAETPGKSSAAAAGVKALAKEMKKGKDAGETMADGIDTALGNLINRIGDGTAALKDFALELVKMFAIRGISKVLGGSSWFDGPLIGKNALGTDNWRGGLSWVGERGPELVNLPRGAQVIPNNKIGPALGGSGMSISYAPTIHAPGASAEAVQSLQSELAADRARFGAKVVEAVTRAKAERKLK